MKTDAFENRIWLSAPTMHGDETKYVEEAIRTNWVSTEGENLVKIEELVRERLGCGYAVPLSCGTAALHLAVKLSGLKRGERVFCSDMTFAASANAVLYEGGIPVFIDCEYSTWNMDPIALERAFEAYPDTRLIICTDLYGTPARYYEIKRIAEKHGAVLIEDAAESMGARYGNRNAGTLGEYNVISFNGNKIITGSSGGMLLTDDGEASVKARKLSTQSREAAPWYQHSEVGYNYRMSNIIAGVVRGQLPYLDEHVKRKKEIYLRYAEGFKGLPITMNPYTEGEMEPNFWLSCILIDENAMAEQIRGETEGRYVLDSGKSCPDDIFDTLAQYNAQARPIWKPMHLQPLYRENSFVTAEHGWDQSEDKSVSADIFCRGLCLPSDIKMTSAQQDKIIRIVKSCFS